MSTVATGRFVDGERAQLRAEFAVDDPELLAYVQKAAETKPRQDFTEWFLRRLEEEAHLGFISGREQMQDVLKEWLREFWRAPLTPAQHQELAQLTFDLSSAVSLDLAGLDVPSSLLSRLSRLGFQRSETVGFPTLAWRFGAIREAAERLPPTASYTALRALARQTPLTALEEAAMRWASLHAATQLRPIFLADGQVISDARLAAEQLWIRAMVTHATETRIDALTLARNMYRLRAPDTYRDYERVARTELANSYAHGAFHHEVAHGRYQPDDEVYRIPRPAACRICLVLFTTPDGSPRRYRVQDLLAETTPRVNVGIRKERLVQATIGVPHPNDLCSPWIKAWPGRPLPGDRDRYRVARDAAGLDVWTG